MPLAHNKTCFPLGLSKCSYWGLNRSNLRSLGQVCFQSSALLRQMRGPIIVHTCYSQTPLFQFPFVPPPVPSIAFNVLRLQLPAAHPGKCWKLSLLRKGGFFFPPTQHGKGGGEKIGTREEEGRGLERAGESLVWRRCSSLPSTKVGEVPTPWGAAGAAAAQARP